MEAAERALELDPNLSDAHAAKGRALLGMGRFDDAMTALQAALRLDPDSYEANVAAGRCAATQLSREEAIGYFEKAAQMHPSDFSALGIAGNLYEAAGDVAAATLTARRTLDRIEKVIAAEPDHGTALSFGILSLVNLGEIERAMEWVERALLLDPENVQMKYNIGCAMLKAGKIDHALDILSEALAHSQRDTMHWIKTDPDLDPVRDHPRFKRMVADADARLAAAETAGPSLDP